MFWRLVRESNPRLPARQAGTLATELTKQSIHPVTGSGAAQSLRPISTPEALARREFLFWCRVRESNPRPHLERVVSSAD
jgi:hypothetical protein